MIGKKLNLLRKQHGFSLRKLAEITGVSHSFISDIEHERCNPSLGTLLSLARALQVNPEFFLTEVVADSELRQKAKSTT